MLHWIQSSVLPRERAWKTNALRTPISTFSLECLICFMYVFLSVCLLQVRFVYPCVTSYHFYALTKATRILGRVDPQYLLFNALVFGWGTKVYVQNPLEPSSDILHRYHLTRGSKFTSQDYTPSSVVYVPEPITYSHLSVSIIDRTAIGCYDFVPIKE